MFKYSIKDIIWLMVVVAMALTWGADRWRQSAKMQALTDIAGIKSIKIFPDNWEGISESIRNDNRILRMQVDALTRELQTRGHRVEFKESNVFVDRPDWQH